MKIALITGSCGLVGSESVIFFSKKGFKIIGIDNNARKFFFGKEGDVTWIKNKLKSNLKNYILKEFDIYLKKSTESIILLKKSNVSKHKLLLLNSKINYNLSYFIFRIVQTMLYDVSLKNEILSEIEKIKIKYLELIKNKLK